MAPPADLSELHPRLGYQRLNRTWAKLEIVLGLAAAGAGLFSGNRAAAAAEWAWAAAGLALFVLGGYLATAGHRSHLYQSSNELTAYLADEIRHSKEKGSPA